jgi:hypothetical protein
MLNLSPNGMLLHIICSETKTIELFYGVIAANGFTVSLIQKAFLARGALTSFCKPTFLLAEQDNTTGDDQNP